MSELNYGNFDVRPEDLDAAQTMFSIVEKNLHSPNPNLDPVEASMLAAIHDGLLMSGRTPAFGQLRPHLEQAITFRRERGSYFPPAYGLRVMEFAIDKQLRAKLPEYYPQQFDDPRMWQHFDVFGRVIDMNELFEDMTMHDLQTSRPSAYAIYHILTQLHGGSDQIVLDNGTGLRLGPMRWLAPGERPFEIKAFQKPRRGPIAPEEMIVDEEVQARLDHLRRKPPVVRKLVGYDAYPIHPEDEEAKARIFSQTLPFSQSLNRPDEAADFRRLAAASADKVIAVREHIRAADIDSLSVLRDPEYLGNELADAGIMSAFLFSNSPEEVAAILKNQTGFYKPGAKIYIADFAKSNPDAPFGVEFIGEDWWTRLGSFSLFELDPHQLEKPALKLGTFMDRYGDGIILSGVGRRRIMEAPID